MTGTIESLGSNPFVWAGFMQISREAAVSVRIHNTDYEERSRGLGHNSKRKSLWISE